MQLTFEHVCQPPHPELELSGCPIVGREVYVHTELPGRDNEYQVPDVRCLHTNTKLTLVAVDGNRDI